MGQQIGWIIKHVELSPIGRMPQCRERLIFIEQPGRSSNNHRLLGGITLILTDGSLLEENNI